MIEQIFVNALAILGLYIVTKEGMIGFPIRELFSKVPFLNKPLIECVICMSSIYGTIFFLFKDTFLIELFSHILAVAGLLYVITHIVSMVKQITAHMDLKKLLDDNDK